MFRLPAESNNLNTYVPGSRTFPGISTGALKVITVFLSHVSALAGSKTAPASSATENNVGSIFNRVISFTSLYPRLNVDVRSQSSAPRSGSRGTLTTRPLTNSQWHAVRHRADR